MEPDESVVLTIVPNEPEAEILCGLLKANGIDCDYRETDSIDSPIEGFVPAGPQEVRVRAEDLEAARALLPEG